MKLDSIEMALEKYRLLHDMKQKDLAAYLGCKPEQVSRWIKGRIVPGRKWQRVMKERGVL